MAWSDLALGGDTVGGFTPREPAVLTHSGEKNSGLFSRKLGYRKA